MNMNEDLHRKKVKTVRAILAFAIASICLVFLCFAAMNIGSLKVGFQELFGGIFSGNLSDNAATVVDLRFPRIIISVIAGAAIAVSGTLFQAVLKNPLADPGIIGISGGASLAAVLVTAFLPSLFFFMPIAACCGGILAFVLVYTLSWKDGLSPLRIILVGVAVSAVFSGLSSALNSMNGGNMQGVAAIVNGNITMKTWSDVYMLLPYAAVGLTVSLFVCNSCNILSLEDKTARGLGVNVSRLRVVISVIAAVLVSVSTAVAGVIGFIGLIVPHIGRILVGSDHKKLVPFSMIFGALVFLCADTVGRTIAAPYEVSASIIMNIVGGPFFIILLRRSKKYV